MEPERLTKRSECWRRPIYLPLEKKPSPGAIETRAQTNPVRFRVEQDAERYAEYVAKGWGEPETQDVGQSCVRSSHRRTKANLIPRH